MGGRPTILLTGKKLGLRMPDKSKAEAVSCTS